MRYRGEPVQARFGERKNRFAATVRLAGREELVHVPNSGRMRELLRPGAAVQLLRREGAHRRTRWDLVAVDTGRTLVSVDSRVPNAVFAEAVREGLIPELEGFDDLRPEVTWGGSRFDFLLSGEEGDALVEVKGCTLVTEDGLALFPDAPTARGVRHVRGLAEAREAGRRSLVMVVVQRDDGRVFAPNDGTDRAFGDALREAAGSGVEVLAYSTRVTLRGVELADPVPVDLEAALEVVV